MNGISPKNKSEYFGALQGLLENGKFQFYELSIPTEYRKTDR